MDQDIHQAEVSAAPDAEPQVNAVPTPAADTIENLRRDYEDRLLVANLKTEAVKAGMIDLDGLRLIDTSTIRLDANDNVVNGAALMADLRRNKPWLFGLMSSSSTSSVPASGPVRTKMAMDMNDEEYAAARAAMTRHQY